MKMRGPRSILFQRLAVLTILAVLVSLAINRSSPVSQLLNLNKTSSRELLTKHTEYVNENTLNISISSPSAHELVKRWTTCDWTTALDKVPSELANPCQKIVQAGQKIFCMLRAKEDDPNIPIPKTQFENDADLETYGWDYEAETLSSEDVLGNGQHRDNDYSGLLDAFGGVDPRLDTNGWVKIKAEHYGNDQWPNTGGTYGTVVNKGKGALITYAAWSPEFENMKQVGTSMWVPPEKMTPLARRSDVVYLSTKRHFNGASDAFKNIKHFFEHDLSGEIGLDVVRMIVGRENPDRPEDNWPGTVLQASAGDPKFFAALGSPNSKFLGWLYGQTKR
ncbi:hypothetical protein HII31_13729 [Pseudocercospora fuligena]|uniref:Uncharacterized protein n=1 Tax=Pseudocercospora fuligena TaxID=685502 RepID=A0A8H6VBU7_9PEZI|nr:hypothetical protein HII31_13729 [Pseudocercospora fuligena]